MTYEPALMARLRRIVEDVSRVNDDWFASGAFKTWKNPTPVKYEVADAAGTVDTLEGPVRYAAGHYIMTGPKGERYPITPEKFKTLYDDNGNGTATPKRVEKWAKVADHDGVLHTSWGDLAYTTGADYIVRHGPGDYGAVKADIFAKTYHLPGEPKDTLAESAQDHRKSAQAYMSKLKKLNKASEADQIAAVKVSSYAVDYIQNPSQAVQTAAVYASPIAITKIKNPTLETQVLSIERDPTIVGYIKNPSPELWTNPHVKQLIITNLLEIIKAIYDQDDEDIDEDPDDEVGRTLYKLAEHKVTWPEIEVIKKSLMASGLYQEPTGLDESQHTVHWALMSDVFDEHDIDSAELARFYEAYFDNEFDDALVLLNDYLEDGRENGAWWGALRAVDLENNPVDEDEPLVCFDRNPKPNTNKDAVIKQMLQDIKNDEMPRAASRYLMLRKNGVDWPELDTIGKSIDPQNNLSESITVTEDQGIGQDQLLDAMRKFLVIAKEEIGLDRLPKIHWSWDDKIAPDSPSFGRFTNDDKAIKIIMRNRHPIDIMRTLAHELVHYKQDVEHKIGPESGETGSPIENEANALAGQIMRRFDQENPELFALGAVTP